MKIRNLFINKYNHKVNGNGFSLLEVLLGITIFMIGMLGVTALNISSLKSNTFSGNMSEAVIIAGGKIEELMAIDFGDPQLVAGDHVEDKKNNGDGSLVPDGVPDPVGRNGMYTVTWNVEDGNPVPAKTKTLNVIVEWSIKDVERRINMSMIIQNDD